MEQSHTDNILSFNLNVSWLSFREPYLVLLYLSVTLKADLQKTNSSISNMVIAIEKGIITETTKTRLEELETTRKDLQEKIDCYSYLF